jgi:hypothetical protein
MKISFMGGRAFIPCLFSLNIYMLYGRHAAEMYNILLYLLGSEKPKFSSIPYEELNRSAVAPPVHLP